MIVSVAIMPGILHLLRHGTHAEVGKRLSGRSEIALDERGRAEAAALAPALDSLPIASIHSSPRRRALETAAPLAERRGFPVHIAPALDEIDFGIFAGRDFVELDADSDWMRWNAERPRFRCPGGETMAEAVERAWSYLSALPAEAMPALCVTHCDVIRGIVAARLGLDGIFALGCDPASLTSLAIEGDGVRLLTLNARLP